MTSRAEGRKQPEILDRKTYMYLSIRLRRMVCKLSKLTAVTWAVTFSVL